MRSLVLLLALAVLASAANLRLSASTLPRKNLGGPASEFASKLLPHPSGAAVAEQSALFKVKYAPETNDLLCFSQSLQVDGTQAFAFSLFYSQEQLVHYKLYDPSSNEVELQDHEYLGNFPVGDSGNFVPTATYWFATPVIGLWTLSGECNSALALPTEKDADMIIVLWNSDDTKVYSRLSTYNLTEGAEIGLVATVFDESADPKWQSEKRTPARHARISLGGTVMQAEMAVTLPTGKTVKVAMHDDGQHNDEAAGDGVYGALVKAAEVGTYQAQAFIRGFTSSGVQYIRSSQQLLRVVPNSVKLQNAAIATAKGDGSIDVLLVVDHKATQASEAYTAYAEVWGTDKSGSLVPVSWIGGAVDITEFKGQKVLPLVFSQKWLSFVGASEPLVLKNVFVQNELIPVTAQSSMVVKMTNAQLLKLNMNVTEIDEEMYWGKRPASLTRRFDASSSGKLMLVHGYCAADNPFEASADKFTDALYFKNPDASISNDEFAQKIAAYAKSTGIASFGLIAHSQGGLASVTLHNYYWSELENAVGGRIIQSVGSPYGGSSLAGSSADLGKVFGVGCGSCYDLTHDGAALWVTGITSQAASAVNYYTTQYKDGGFVNYCNLGANLLLKWPNDGVTETTYSLLTGGISAGHSKAECHTDGMQWPPQCDSGARNTEMNQLAAR